VITGPARRADPRLGLDAGTEVRVEGEELMVVREEDVMAVIESK
jgi:hypothetical protein